MVAVLCVQQFELHGFFLLLHRLQLVVLADIKSPPKYIHNDSHMWFPDS